MTDRRGLLEDVDALVVKVIDSADDNEDNYEVAVRIVDALVENPYLTTRLAIRARNASIEVKGTKE